MIRGFTASLLLLFYITVDWMSWCLGLTPNNLGPVWLLRYDCRRSREEETSVGVWREHKWSVKCAQRQKKKRKEDGRASRDDSSSSDSFTQKTISFCSQRNVRFPSALVAAASRRDSTCQRGRAGREPSLGLTRCPGASEQDISPPRCCSFTPAVRD